jgi:hypothetical protein
MLAVRQVLSCSFPCFRTVFGWRIGVLSNLWILWSFQNFWFTQNTRAAHCTIWWVQPYNQQSWNGYSSTIHCPIVFGQSNPNSYGMGMETAVVWLCMVDSIHPEFSVLRTRLCWYLFLSILVVIAETFRNLCEVSYFYLFLWQLPKPLILRTGPIYFYLFLWCLPSFVWMMHKKNGPR